MGSGVQYIAVDSTWRLSEELLHPFPNGYDRESECFSLVRDSTVCCCVCGAMSRYVSRYNRGAAVIQWRSIT